MSDLTQSQKRAIETRGHNLLVSAGAGSGKTFVLVSRLMKYITDEKDPKNIDSFVIITYTRAAAAELRNRITEALSAAAAKDPDNVHLRKQTALIRKTQIGTIHSFCGKLLRENCQLSGLSPNFGIVSEEQALALRKTALEKTLESFYADPDAHPGFTELAGSVGAGRDDSRLVETVENLYSKMQSHARPEMWAAYVKETMRTDVDDISKTLWGEELMKSAKRRINYWIHEMEAMQALMLPDEKVSAAYMGGVVDMINKLRFISASLDQGWDSARASFPNDYPRMGSLKTEFKTDVSERVMKRRDKCKKDLGTMKKDFPANSAELLEEVKSTERTMSALLDLALAYDRAYRAEKRRRNLVDYSDLEHMAAALLTDDNGNPTALAQSIADRYTEIMVDEYQDVSRVQETIFNATAGRAGKLFMVGDAKQSIYRFRLADPSIFSGKEKAYSEGRENGEVVFLRDNFRSRKEILDGANAVFSACMSEELGEIQYDDTVSLICGADYEGEGVRPEILLLDMEGADTEEERPDKDALEAEMTAVRIKELLESGETVRDGSSSRPIRPGDIAVLLRASNSVGGIYRRKLMELGIPVTSGQGTGFFDSPEIAAVTALLAVIDNPHRDVELIAALSSPLFGFSADDLARVRAESRKGNLYTALRAAAEKEEKIAAAVREIDDLRAKAPDMYTDELLREIIVEKGFMTACAAMRDGAQKRSNLNTLISMAAKFEDDGYHGLHSLNVRLAQLKEKGVEPSAGNADASAVQILSIHKSKGLQFPVVFLCNTGRNFNRQDTKEPVLIHPVLGLGPSCTDYAKRIEYPTVAKKALESRIKRENLSEEMRVLYVAMTRAKERLFITAAFADVDKFIADKVRPVAQMPMEPEAVSGMPSFIGWILAAGEADEYRHLSRPEIIKAGNIGFSPEKTAKPDEDSADVEDFYTILADNLRFVYPYENASDLPSKITATEIKTYAQPEPDEAHSIVPVFRKEFDLPDFAGKDSPATGRERGIATHLALQHIDLTKTASLAEIEDEVRRLLGANFLTARQAACVDTPAVQKLFASELGERIRRADEIRREFKFSLLVSADEALGCGGDEQILLQGVTDLCIREGETITIVDYKTDAVFTDEQISARTAMYAPQIRSYAAAMKRILGYGVKECVLYYLRAGRAVSVKDF